MARVEGATPIDVAEARPCAHCGKGMMHDGSVTFYEISVAVCIIDLPNVRRMHGMELMMSGAVGIARALSPDNTVAHRIGKPSRRWICQPCGLLANLPVASLMIEEEDRSDG